MVLAEPVWNEFVAVIVILAELVSDQFYDFEDRVRFWRGDVVSLPVLSFFGEKPKSLASIAYVDK